MLRAVQTEGEDKCSRPGTGCSGPPWPRSAALCWVVAPPNAMARSHHRLPPRDFKALFNLSTGAIPHPIDLFFAGSTDGTLNLPAIAYRPAAMRDALNTLDGWSTSATLSTGFSTPLQGSTALRDQREAGGDVFQQHDEGPGPRCGVTFWRNESGPSLARLRNGLHGRGFARRRQRRQVPAHHSTQAAHAELRRHEHRLPRDPDQRHPGCRRPAGTAR